MVGCSARFLRKENLDKHKERKHGGGGEDDGGNWRFKCKFCGKGCWGRTDFVRHENSHGKKGGRLGEGDFNFRCGTCGKGFNVRRCLRQHEIHGHNLPKLQ